MRHIVLSFVTRRSPLHFSKLFHKQCDFLEIGTEHKMCVFTSLQLLSKTFLILRIIQRDIVKKSKGLHVKHPLFLADFNETRIFSTDFRKKELSTKFHRSPSRGSRVVPY
jgi:hypothetical protein